MWLYSLVHKGQKQQAVDYTSLIVSDMDREHKTWKALQVLDTLFVLMCCEILSRNALFFHTFLSMSTSFSNFLSSSVCRFFDLL